ncbi:MAG: hypothetical protein HYV19_01775 [Gemmatimonadetes bacterium]|nr:hypothetical protein [Gemmatimonadota bacterium]
MVADEYPSIIAGVIEADEIRIGKGVVVEERALITGNGGPARLVELGDFSFIGRDTRIMVPELRLGDYSKVHAFTFGHGNEPLRIGRNCWIGGMCVLDSLGGLDLDDGVGVGAHSQIWTHIKFGDLVQGCRFYTTKYMHVQHDAWFVGHCIISPVNVAPRAMALVGSVITSDMSENRVYAGTPARDITDKVGPQFANVTVDQKVEVMRRLIAAYELRHPEHAGCLGIVQASDSARDCEVLFDVESRTYTRTYSPAEVGFLKANVPLVKFVPVGVPSFFVPGPPAAAGHDGMHNREGG